MKSVKTQTLPHEIKEIENTWIRMRDGTRLAARIWMPEDAEERPVPAILEYIPYRKRDVKRSRDSRMHAYFAAHGYAAVRVDIRGSGDSEGVLEDEYLPIEQQDGEDILQWLEDQPWCNGSVGMIGISWGGFNGLQIAARRPPQLKAVISLCSTDDRYADDVHYMGGCLLNDNLSWASTMFAFNSMPPDPQIVGDDWYDMWMQRLKGSGLWVEKWMRHQHRDNYWKHGSICEDYSAVQCPVMAVSGWADGYSNAVFRMLANLEVPRKGLVGPWSHVYPHMGEPGPQIGFLQECLRWWDKWLKGEETGVMDEPMLRVWMQESVLPKADYRKRPGRWVSEPTWPSDNIEDSIWQFGRWRLLHSSQEDECEQEAMEPLSVRSPRSVGLFAGKWCSYTGGPDMPYDQRESDGASLVFDSDTLEQTFEILGAPVLDLQFSVDKPVAQIAVRLSDIDPDDKVTRVTYGVLNLCHRNSHEQPERLEPGKKYRVHVQLNDIAQKFPAGNRIRISISTTYWPLIWPSPEPVRLTVYPENCRLILPERPPRPDEEEELEAYERSEAAPGPQTTTLKTGDNNWLITRDLARDESMLHVINDEGVKRIEDIDLELRKQTWEWYRYKRFDYNSSQGEVYAVRELRRGDWNPRTETRTILTCNEDAFHITATLDAYLAGRRVFCHTWNRTIRREHL